MENSRIAIITGSSRGLGKALLQQCCENHFKVVSIARNKPDFSHHNILTHFDTDLSNSRQLEQLIDEIMLLLQNLAIDRLFLINNAARLGIIKKMVDQEQIELKKTIDLNLVGPMTLNSLLLNRLKIETIEWRFINISSGAAFHAIHGLGPYCISKAGLEMMSQSFALENNANESFKSICISPGVVDTDMQRHIRSSTKEDFDRIEQFTAFKSQGLLSGPQETAKKIVDLLMTDAYNSGESIDITTT